MKNQENFMVSKKSSAGSCCSPKPVTTSSTVASYKKENNILPLQQLMVEGATCGGCVSKIEKVLMAATDVNTASMDLSTGIATVVGKADIQSLIHALEQVGFNATAAQ